MTQTKIATVFGGSGFIGHYIVSALAKAGYQVRIPTRNPAAAADLRPMGDVGQVVPVACPLGNDAALASMVKGADVVINLLGILYETRRQKFGTIHTELPGRIAKAAQAAGVKRFIHISAIGANTQGTAHYAKSKGEGERAVRSHFPAATILRPSIVFGPEDAFFNRFAGMTRMSPFLPLIGGGQTKFQPVYAGDVASAVMAALTLPHSAGQTYELGGPKVYTFKELMQLVLTSTHRKRCLMNIPWGLAKVQASLLGLLPNPLLTRDQVELLKNDNVVSPTALSLKDLGLAAPEAVENLVPTYLARFIPGGMVRPRTGRA